MTYTTGLNLVESGNRDAGARAAIDELRTAVDALEASGADVVVLNVDITGTTAETLTATVDKKTYEDLSALVYTSKKMPVLNINGGVDEATEGELVCGLYPLTLMQIPTDNGDTTFEVTFGDYTFTAATLSDPLVYTKSL